MAIGVKRFTVSALSFMSKTYELAPLDRVGPDVWNDEVGTHFTKATNAVIQKFDEHHEGTWECIEPLLCVREDDVQYSSRKGEINGLWVD